MNDRTYDLLMAALRELAPSTTLEDIEFEMWSHNWDGSDLDEVRQYVYDIGRDDE